MKFDDKAETLFEAAKILRKYCSEIKCKNCIFHIDGWCTIDDVPEDWQIEDAERELNV